MDFKIITYGTEEYDVMVGLRKRILKDPFNILFTDKEKDEDKTENILLGAFSPNSNQLVACCILNPINSEYTIKLRQMAVDDFYQGKGLGAELMKYAESVAKDNNYKYIYLHARRVAVDFYKKQGYTIEGGEFMEVGLPHFEMLKSL